MKSAKLTATNISRGDAVKFESFGSDTAVISISSPGYNYFDYEQIVQHSNMLRMEFADINKERREVEFDNKTITLYGMNDNQARIVVNFIEENKDKNFIVHCDAGVSRSAAICLYINLKYGHSLKPNFWALSHPNAHVKAKLMKFGGLSPVS